MSLGDIGLVLKSDQRNLSSLTCLLYFPSKVFLFSGPTVWNNLPSTMRDKWLSECVQSEAEDVPVHILREMKHYTAPTSCFCDVVALFLQVFRLTYLLFFIWETLTAEPCYMQQRVVKYQSWSWMIDLGFEANVLASALVSWLVSMLILVSLLVFWLPAFGEIKMHIPYISVTGCQHHTVPRSVTECMTSEMRPVPR